MKLAKEVSVGGYVSKTTRGRNRDRIFKSARFEPRLQRSHIGRTDFIALPELHNLIDLLDDRRGKANVRDGSGAGNKEGDLCHGVDREHGALGTQVKLKQRLVCCCCLCPCRSPSFGGGFVESHDGIAGFGIPRDPRYSCACMKPFENRVQPGVSKRRIGKVPRQGDIGQLTYRRRPCLFFIIIKPRHAMNLVHQAVVCVRQRRRQGKSRLYRKIPHHESF